MSASKWCVSLKFNSFAKKQSYAGQNPEKNKDMLCRFLALRRKLQQKSLTEIMP